MTTLQDLATRDALLEMIAGLQVQIVALRGVIEGTVGAEHDLSLTLRQLALLEDFTTTRIRQMQETV